MYHTIEYPYIKVSLEDIRVVYGFKDWMTPPALNSMS